MSAPRRLLDPEFPRRIAASGHSRAVLAKKCRFSHQQALDIILRSDRVVCTPLTVGRLVALATIIGYPPARIFLDEPAKEEIATVGDAVTR
jgi:hypothetical protein